MVEDARTRWETARVLRDDDARRARGGDGDIAGEVKTLKVLKKRRSHRERGRIGTSLTDRPDEYFMTHHAMSTC